MSPCQALPAVQLEKPVLARIAEALDQGRAARGVPLSDEERLAVRGLQLLTMKPLIYAINVAEADLANQGTDNPHVAAIAAQAQKDSCDTVLVSAQVGAWSRRGVRLMHQTMRRACHACAAQFWPHSGGRSLVFTCSHCLRSHTRADSSCLLVLAASA